MSISEYSFLYILDSNLTCETVSISRYKSIIEYQIVLFINAAILMNDKNVYPIRVKVCRIFFYNQQTPLALDTLQQTIINEMYNQAAIKLVYKLSSIKNN